MDQYWFLDEGIRVFGLYGFDEDGACHCGNPDCQAAGKHPNFSSWQHTPMWSDEQLEVMEMSGQFDTGYGVIVNGLIIIDVDARNGGVKSFEKLCKDLNTDFLGIAGLAVATGSGQGSMHLYFKAPEGVPLMQHHKEYEGIDFKSSGFVVGPNSKHASGNTYEAIHGSPAELDDAPQCLIDLLKKPDTHRADYKGAPIDVTDSDISEMLSFVDSDCDHEVWYRCGMAVHDATSGAGFDIWDDWSSKGKKYPGSGALEKRWHSFGKSGSPVTIATLMHYAEEGGYQQSVTFKPTIEFEIEEEENKSGLPFSIEGVDLLRPPEFVGQVTKWINEQSRYPRENLAVAAALTAVGNVVGMRYTDDLDGVNANLFCFCVAGSGCHEYGHEILMYDGSTKEVQNIAPGELLMGPDSKPRKVNALARGVETMVKITPVKGESFVVNINHIMRLQKTGTNEQINISIKDYMGKNSKFKSQYKIVRTGVDFINKEDLPLGAYTVGALIGDGTTKDKIQLTGMDSEIHDKFKSQFLDAIPEIKFKTQEQKSGNKSWHTVLTMGRTGRKYKKDEAPHLSLIKKIGLLGKVSGDKFIPREYLTSSKANRLELLAGLIDTDGSYNGCGGYDYITKSEKLADDILFLCRSLGLAAYKKISVKKSQSGIKGDYYRVSISGDCDQIPVLLERKKAPVRKQIKNVLVTGFKIEEMPANNFYGFAISGDHLYLDKSFTVHHNTGKEAVQQAQAAIHRAAGIHGATHGAIKSEQEIIRNLIRNQMAAYIIDEVGIFLQKIANAQKKGGAAYLDGVIGMMMSAYSKADGFMLLTGDTKDEVQKAMMQELANCRKSVSENDDKTGAYQRRIPQLERSLQQIDNGLERPFLSMIGYTTPVTFDGLITHEQATNGFIGRSLLINERETNPRAKRRFKKAPMPESMEYTLKALYSGGSFDQDCNRVEYYGPKIEIKTEANAVKMLDAALDWIEDEAEKHKERTGLEAVVRRGYEIMAKISLILAAPSGVRTSEHVRWAFAMMQRDIEEKTRLAYANEREKDSPHQAMAAKILNLINSDHGETVGVICNRLRPAKKEEIEEVLKSMEENNLIKSQQTKSKYNGKVATKYFSVL